MTARTGGVRIAGTGSAVPARTVTNHDLAAVMDTSHDWIVQRTGIHRRHMIDPPTESAFTLSRDSIRRALDSAGLEARDLDTLIVASVTAEMRCPSTACRIAGELDAGSIAAFDLLAACSGFTYGINLADSLIRSGRHRAVGVVGCDALSTICDFNERSVSILFGDAAGAMVLVADDDPGRGCIYQTLGSDGAKWEHLYLPRRHEDVPEWDLENPIELGNLRMNGREVFRFAVSKFREVIQDALEATGLTVDDVAQFVCHQSNARIIEAAKERLGLPAEKVHVNIDEYGNTSAGSVGLVFDELWQAGKISEGDIVVVVAFGAGLTWASGVWRV